MTAARVVEGRFRGVKGMTETVTILLQFVVSELVPLRGDYEFAHKMRFWYLLGVFSKISTADKHPRHFHRGVHLPGQEASRNSSGGH